MNVEVNYLAILIAGVVSMAVGFAWYSTYLFGKPWMKLMGYSAKELKKEQQKMGPMYFLSFVLSLVTAFVLTHLIAQAENFYGLDRITTSLITAFWSWLGLIMPVQITEVIFGNKKWMLFAINTGYQLVAILAMGLVIGIL